MRRWVKKQLGFAERDESRNSHFLFAPFSVVKDVSKSHALAKNVLFVSMTREWEWGAKGGVEKDKVASTIISDFPKREKIFFYVRSLVLRCICTAKKNSSHKKTIKKRKLSSPSIFLWRGEKVVLGWDQNMMAAGEWITVTFNSARIP